MEAVKDDEKDLAVREGISDRKPYRKPVMVIYDNLSEVTGGTDPSNFS